MDDLSKIEHKEYIPAQKTVYSFLDLVKFQVKLYYTLFKCLIESIPDMFVFLKDKLLGVERKDIRDQIALVTGGGNGLGKQIALELARHGCHIAIADIVLKSAEEVANEIREKYNVKAKAFKTDVSNFNEIQQLKEDIESSLGHVDILVNNAGIFPLISLREGSAEEVQKIVNVNMSAQLWTCRAFLNGMINRKRGHILAISSIAGFVPYPRGCVYNATKFGVRGFMDSLYMELCLDKHDEIIHLTTAFPTFLQTRQEINNLLDVVGDVLPRLDPEATAKTIVDGVLTNKMAVYDPTDLFVLSKLISFFPYSFLKKITFDLLKSKHFKFMDNGL